MEKETSPFMEEIIGKLPSKAIRYGTISIVVSFLLLLILTSIIRYNDVVSGKVIITSRKPVANLQAQRNGVVQNIFVINGDSVKTGQPLAVLKSEVSFDDVQFIRDKLEAISTNPKITLDSLNVKYPAQLSLGELQDPYLKFYLEYQNVILTDSINFIKLEGVNLEEQMSFQEQYIVSKKVQLTQVSKRLKISKNNMLRSEKLLLKGVIAEREHEKTTSGYYSILETYQQLRGEISSHQIELSKLQNSFSGNTIQRLKSNTSYQELFFKSVESLKSSLDAWEREFVFRSPIDGTVSLFKVWDKYQNVKVGETVFAVVPMKIESLVGNLEIPARNSGKVLKGQDVIIKLETYPFEQYGYLMGKVEGVSTIPDQNTMNYNIFISLNDMTTNYGKSLPFNQELVGNAQIITERLSLLERIFYVFRKLSSNTTNS